MSECGRVAGFVLAGGQSRRMGRDKALLEYSGETLIQAVATEVLKAAGSVALLGDPARYGHLGLPVIPDIIAGCGPMSGLHAALLAAGHSDWVLLAACDLPNLEAGFLRSLIQAARPPIRCVATHSDRGIEPLCAVYHRNTLVEVESALRGARWRMRDLAASLGAVTVEAGARLVRNVNTEEDWQLHLAEKERL